MKCFDRWMGKMEVGDVCRRLDVKGECFLFCLFVYFVGVVCLVLIVGVGSFVC